MFFLRNKKPKRSSTLYNVISSLTYATLDEAVANNLTPAQKIENGRKFIFNFNYMTPDNVDADAFKEYFETAFITKYLTRFFAYETFELFQIKLQNKMLTVMPQYYLKLSAYYADEDNYLKDVSTSESTSSSTNKNKSVNAALPVGIINTKVIGDVNYADSGNLANGENDSTSKTVTTGGVTFDKRIKYNEYFNGLFESLLNEFQDLFNIIM